MYVVFSVEFADQYLALSTILPGTESLYGLGEHKVSLKLKKLVVLVDIHVQVLMMHACMHTCLEFHSMNLK